MLMLFKILVLFFSLFTVSNVIKRKKEGVLSFRGAVFWVIFWLVVILAVFWPNNTQILADFIGIGRGVDLVIYISIALLFFLIFRLHIKVEGINRNITKIIRMKALDEHKKNN